MSKNILTGSWHKNWEDTCKFVAAFILYWFSWSWCSSRISKHIAFSSIEIVFASAILLPPRSMVQHEHCYLFGWKNVVLRDRNLKRSNLVALRAAKTRPTFVSTASKTRLPNFDHPIFSQHWDTSSSDCSMEKQGRVLHAVSDVWSRNSPLILAKSRQSNVANVSTVSRRD